MRPLTAVDEFWDVFETSGNPMLLVDDARVYTAANAAACRLLGRRREEIVGRALGAFTAPSRAPEVDAAWRDFVAAGHTVRPWAVTGGDGRACAVNVSATADVPARGSHLGVLLPVHASPARGGPGHLSPREREITRLLAHGLSGEAIAQELFLSPETVRTHIRNAMEHAGARTRAHLVAVSLRDGLIED